MGAYRCLVHGFAADFGGEPMRTGYLVMLIGVGGAVLGRNPDSYAMAVMCLLGGLALLRVKGV